MTDKIVNHFVLADGSTAKYDYSELANLPFGDDVTEVSFKTRTGYINVNGYQEGPNSDTQEVYTNKIPCFSGDTFTIDLDWNGNTSSKWVGFATFDKDGRFIARNVFGGWNTSLSTASLTTPAMPDGAYYVAFTYRTYGDCTASIKHEGSYFDIRNRADKGLLLSDEWDTIYGIDSEAETNGVCRLGYVTISNFVSIAGKTLVVEKDASYTTALWAKVAYFDGDKNHLSDSGWKQVTTVIAPPTNAVYARIMFDGTNNPNNPSTSPTPETVRENIKIYTLQESVEALTPIIMGHNTGLYYPEWDTVNHTFTIPHDCIFFKNGKYYLPSTLSGAGTDNTVLNIPTDNSSAMRLYFDLSTNNYKWRAYNTNTTATDDLILVAVFRINKPGTSFKPVLSIACPYKIDGKLYGIDTTATVDFDAIAWAFNENVKGVNHRGYYTAPENTLPAYKLSKQVGFKYCECDVSMTSDRVPVLLHDDTINRTARNSDGTEISETISIGSITYEQALQYDFGIWKGSQYAGTKIPTFEQFITLCRNLGLHPYIELKSAGGYSEAEVQNLVDIVKQNGMDGKVTWISFSNSLLAYVKNYDASARLGFIVGALTSANITTASSLKTTTNEVFLDVSSISDDLVDDCITAGLPVEVWTINSTSGITALNDYISGVTSDNLIASKVLYEENI